MGEEQVEGPYSRLVGYGDPAARNKARVGRTKKADRTEADKADTEGYCGGNTEAAHFAMAGRTGKRRDIEGDDDTEKEEVEVGAGAGAGAGVGIAHTECFGIAVDIE